jgi:hypothetical protein
MCWTPTQDQDMLFEYTGVEEGVGGRLKGGKYSEYAQRTVRVYKTSRKCVVLIKDGVYDGNQVSSSSMRNGLRMEDLPLAKRPMLEHVTT